MPKKSLRIARAKAGLIVVDIQTRLLPAIFEKERVVNNTVLLIRGAAILGVPIFATEQYPKGLGGTHPQIADALAGVAPLAKVAFSACGAAGLMTALAKRKVADVILCGIESHVCITQTCLDLLSRAFRVFIVADAVSARTAENYLLGLERMRNAGAIMVSTEMLLFELLEKAGTDEFKQILALVK